LIAPARAHQDREQGFSHLNLLHRTDYREFLETNAAAVLPLEDWAEAAGANHLPPDWDYRKRDQRASCRRRQSRKAHRSADNKA